MISLNLSLGRPNGHTRASRSGWLALAILLPGFLFGEFTTADSSNLGIAAQNAAGIYSNTGNALADLDSIKGWIGDWNTPFQYFLYRWSSYWGTFTGNLNSIKSNSDSIKSDIEIIEDNIETSTVALQNVETNTSDIREDVSSIKSLITDIKRLIPSSTNTSSLSSSVAVTNRVSVGPVAVTNSLLINPAYNFNTVYSSYSPPTGSYTFWANASSAQYTIGSRSLSHPSIPTLKGTNFFEDVTAILSTQVRFLKSLAVGDIKTVTLLDSVTNNQSIAYSEALQFHAICTNQLEAILNELRGGSKTNEYDSVIEDLKPGSVDDVTGYEDTDFSNSQFNDRFKVNLSQLSVSSCPQYIYIGHGEYTFGETHYITAGDQSIIWLSNWQNMFSYIRTFCTFLWWGLTCFLAYRLLLCIHYLHTKVIEWTFGTTTSS